jgi:phosphoglycolate phosphatase
MAELALDAIRPYASHGSRGLLSVGFDLSPEHENYEAMREEYLALYDQVLTRKPILFAGVAELLATLDEKTMLWGVVTNKPRRFTQPLLENIGLLARAACVVSGDDAPRPKPHPDTLFLACEQAGVDPQRCWYVGDAERDIQAGKAAGMQTVVAMYGYLGVDDRPQEWGADIFVNAPLELLEFING